MVLPDDLCADLAFINGKIITLDKEELITEAVSIRGNKILRVGSKEYVIESFGEKTDVIDLEGKTLLPGLIDSHMRALGGCGNHRSYRVWDTVRGYHASGYAWLRITGTKHSWNLLIPPFLSIPFHLFVSGYYVF
jgi:predicted amidohydrolase YtcJ